ncbi:MAG: 30S ribosomal protein S1 [Acidobacteriota bacterium]
MHSNKEAKNSLSSRIPTDDAVTGENVISSEDGKPGRKPQDYKSEDFAALYDRTFKKFAEGEVVKGRILKIMENEVMVDIGFKSEGIINKEEFIGSDGKITIKEGDVIDVLLEKSEDNDGYVVLSREKAEKMKIWDDVEKAHAEGRCIKGRVIERIKGGLAVDIGIRAFLPGSLIDIRPVKNLDMFRGKELLLKVIKVNKKRGNIVLSRKAVLEEENEERKKKTLESIEEGKIVKGTVKNITEYGVFVDLGGIDGLVHITDLSWGRINHPSELFSIGDDIEVVVLKYDRDKERVSLGYKQKTRDPWEMVSEKYPIGSRIRGKVVSLTDYGAFVELEEGVEGLIHISEMSWTKKIKHPSKLLSVGDIVESVVLEVDQEARKLSLGLKQTEPNPWSLIEGKYRVGQKIKGKVRNLTDFGAFVSVDEGIDGLVHISDLSWTKRIKHASDVLKKGDLVEAVILKIDSENQRLSLGIKQLLPNAWTEFFANHRVGEILTGKIVRLTDFGAFIELYENVEGLVHVSELSKNRIDKPDNHFSVGQEIRVKIIKMDPEENKIGLSVKAALDEEERRDVKEYIEKQESSRISIGDLVGDFSDLAKKSAEEKSDSENAEKREE